MSNMKKDHEHCCDNCGVDLSMYMGPIEKKPEKVQESWEAILQKLLLRSDQP